MTSSRITLQISIPSLFIIYLFTFISIILHASPFTLASTSTFFYSFELKSPKESFQAAIMNQISIFLFLYLILLA